MSGLGKFSGAVMGEETLLTDRFAMAAMKGICIANSKKGSYFSEHRMMAKEAYRMANTMIRLRSEDSCSLRDEFALAAIEGICSATSKTGSYYSSIEAMAKEAFRLADEMMSAREVKEVYGGKRARVFKQKTVWSGDGAR